jgi:hypothetical protein
MEPYPTHQAPADQHPLHNRVFIVRCLDKVEKLDKRLNENLEKIAVERFLIYYDEVDSKYKFKFLACGTFNEQVAVIDDYMYKPISSDGISDDPHVHNAQSFNPTLTLFHNVHSNLNWTHPHASAWSTIVRANRKKMIELCIKKYGFDVLYKAYLAYLRYTLVLSKNAYTHAFIDYVCGTQHMVAVSTQTHKVTGFLNFIDILKKHCRCNLLRDIRGRALSGTLNNTKGRAEKLQDFLEKNSTFLVSMKDIEAGDTMDEDVLNADDMDDDNLAGSAGLDKDVDMDKDVHDDKDAEMDGMLASSTELDKKGDDADKKIIFTLQNFKDFLETPQDFQFIRDMSAATSEPGTMVYMYHNHNRYIEMWAVFNVILDQMHSNFNASGAGGGLLLAGIADVKKQYKILRDDIRTIYNILLTQYKEAENLKSLYLRLESYFNDDADFYITTKNKYKSLLAYEVLQNLTELLKMLLKAKRHYFELLNEREPYTEFTVALDKLTSEESGTDGTGGTHDAAGLTDPDISLIPDEELRLEERKKEMLRIIDPRIASSAGGYSWSLLTIDRDKDKKYEEEERKKCDVIVRANEELEDFKSSYVGVTRELINNCVKGETGKPKPAKSDYKRWKDESVFKAFNISVDKIFDNNPFPHVVEFHEIFCSLLELENLIYYLIDEIVGIGAPGGSGGSYVAQQVSTFVVGDKRKKRRSSMKGGISYLSTYINYIKANPIENKIIEKMQYKTESRLECLNQNNYSGIDYSLIKEDDAANASTVEPITVRSSLFAMEQIQQVGENKSKIYTDDVGPSQASLASTVPAPPGSKRKEPVQSHKADWTKPKAIKETKPKVVKETKPKAEVTPLSRSPSTASNSDTVAANSLRNSPFPDDRFMLPDYELPILQEQERDTRMHWEGGRLKTKSKTKPKAKKPKVEAKKPKVEAKKPKVVKETKPKVVKETKPKVVKETKPEPKAKPKVEAKKPKAIKETKPKVVKETKPKVVKETKPKAEVKETKPKAIKETKPKVVKETKPKAEVKETKPKLEAKKPKAAKAVKETKPKVVKETKPEPKAIK